MGKKKKKKKKFNESCNSSLKLKVWATEELITSFKSSFEPEKLHGRERLSELSGMSNHTGLLAEMHATMAHASVVNSRGSLPETMFGNYLTFSTWV